MKNHQHKFMPFILLAVGFFVFSQIANAKSPSEKPLIAWTFTPASGMQGWSGNGDLQNVTLTDAGLAAKVIGTDPVLVGPVFQVPLAADQVIEVQIQCDAPGEAQLFWATDLAGKYGGFDEAQSLRFSCRGDGKLHTYRLYPFWHTAPELRRFRFDPPNSGRFILRSIRVVSPAQSSAISNQTEWKFQDDLQGWRVMEGAESFACQNGQAILKSSDPKSAIVSPLLAMDTKGHFYVSFRMATDVGITGEVFVVSKQKQGRESITFRPIADGQMHTYNVDVSSLANWQGEVLCVGIRPTDAPFDNAEDATAVTSRFESIAVTALPAGPVDLQCDYFGPRDTVHRIERPTTVSCLLKNLGGTTAKNITLEIKSDSPEVRIVDESVKKVSAIQLELPSETMWKVAASKPGTYPLCVTVKEGGKSLLTRTCSLTFTKTPPVAADDYIPEPKPVPSKLDVGAFYFPGWPNITKWQPIFDYPNRRPAMGWYDEANPECVDWQIKWAVEHGIDFFMVDWYWNRGGRHLEHWINDGFANAKFKKYLKWCVMWANHNAPGSHSVEDWREVTKFWIDHYFGMKEYYRIDDKPVVVIWAPWGIRNDVGGTEEATKLYAMSQEMAKAAGYKGIYFIAMFSHENEAAYETLRKEGYDAATSYHGFEFAARKHANQKYFDFQEVVDTSPELWKQELDNAGQMAYYPIADTGWDSRPWHKDKSLVIGNRTPEKLKKLCEEAKKFAEANGSPIVMLGPVNEWGEGSYIEPYSEFGFGDLDAVREAFCEPGEYPPNLVPEDIGRGPYELPLPQEKAAWEFDTEQEVLDWNASTIETSFRDGALHGKTFGSDPILTSPPLQINAARFGRLTVRMRSDQDATGQLFWATPSTSTCEANSVPFKVIGDGQFHDYTLDLDSVPGWRGVVTTLRLDPVQTHGIDFDIDFIRLVE